MTATDPSRAGVMDASYADGRVAKLHLNFRYRVRALVAVQGYLHHHPRPPAEIDVLEMGAAEGRTLLHMREVLGLPGRYRGIEYAEDLIESAPTLPEDTSLIQGDVMNLPDEIEAERADLCTALAVLEHLTDPMACVQEAFRSLKPGGVFVATCPNPFWDEIAGAFGLVADEHHEVEVTGAYMVDLAKKAGFADAEFTPFMWVATGALPYLGVALDPALTLQIDRIVAKLGVLNFSFVNQALVARKPG